jgi:HAAS
MNTTELDEVARYAAAVRAGLDDLPTEERDELLEDLEDHLREVAADTEGPLADRIGPPSRYAHELRASAGLAGTGGRPERAGRWPEATTRARRYCKAIRSHAATQAAVEFGLQLRPVWWLVRAYVIVQWLSWLSYAKTDALIPILLGSQAIGFVVLLLACVLSVRLGRRATGAGRASPRYVVANTLLALLTLSFMVQLAQLEGDAGYAAQTSDLQSGDGLWNNGTLVTNIIPVDSEGRLLTNVYLYDQDGQPLQQSVWDGISYWQENCPTGGERLESRLNVYPHDLADASGTWMPYQLPPNLILKGDRPKPHAPNCEPVAAPSWER